MLLNNNPPYYIKSFKHSISQSADRALNEKFWQEINKNDRFWSGSLDNTELNKVVWFNKALNVLMLKWLYRISFLYDDFPTNALSQFEALVMKEQKIRNRVRGPCAIDRANKYRFQYNTTIDKTFPKYKFHNDIPDLETLMFDRAKKIKSTGQTIQFFWSGGIDSTAALCILNEVCPEQLMVQMTPSSIDENERYYNKIVRHLQHNIHTKENIYFVANPQKYVVVECGAADALYGSIGRDHLYGNRTRVWRLRNRFGRSSRRYRFFQDYNYDKKTINLANICPFYEIEDIEKYFINHIIDGSIKPFDRDNDSNYINEKMALRDIIAKYTHDVEFAYGKVGNWSIRANEKKLRILRAGLNPRLSGTIKEALQNKIVYNILAILDNGTILNRSNFRSTNLIQFINLDALPELKNWALR